MAISQVRAQINGTWHKLTYNSTTGKYEVTLTPTAVSSGQSGGYFPVTVEATNSTGQTATLSGSTYPGLRLVVQDTTAPTLTITAPANGYVTSAASVTVSGAVSDNVGVASVTVNGAAATVTNGTFSKSVSLNAGSNTITVKATDMSGNATTVTRTVVRDNTGPTLNVSAPSDELVTANASVTVSGTVSDANGVSSVTVNGTAIEVINGSFSKSVTLSAGSNTITVIATDSIGNTTTITRTVSQATQGPLMTIISPVDGFITNESSILVSGTVSDSVATVSGVTVNGVTATVNGEAFSATVPLSEGNNTLTVIGANSVGLTTTETVSGTLDTVPPEISITAPAAGQMVSEATFTVEGTASDDRSGIAGVTVNGAAATVLNGTFSKTLTLTDGVNTITATATDAAGNTASAVGSVLLDTIPPTLTVANPAGDLITNNPALAVTGEASDSGSGLESVAVNGQPVPVSGGEFSLEVTLQEGQNSVTVTAVDRVGHVTTVIRSVLLDTREPVITLLSPPEGFINSGSPTVTFSVADEPGGSGVDIDTVKVYLDGTPQTGVTVSGGTISFMPSMSDGIHVITVTVDDIAGNRRGLSVTYTVDTVPPEMHLRRPYMRHVVDSEMLEVEAEAADEGTGVASVTAGGYSLVGTGIYSGAVPLAIGENTIAVIAADRAGNTISEELYIIRLVTDRTQNDVEFLRGLYTQYDSFDDWPESAKAWFSEAACLRGSYDAADLNRVGVAVEFLAEALKNRGYAVNVRPKTDWTEHDNPTRGKMDGYVSDVTAVRDAQPVFIPVELPATMRQSTIDDWNNIEKALVEADSVFPNYFAWNSGEISCGEF